MRANDVKSYIAAKDCRHLQNFNVSEYESLPMIGININKSHVKQMMAGKKAMDAMAFSMDAVQPTVTTASVATPVQFLQNWLPGLVYVATAPRKIDDLAGIMISGNWEDEQIVQSILERVGTSLPYGDYSNVPLSSWNTNFNYRTVVRFEEGMKVGILEAARAARMLVDDSGAKREAAALALDIQRNNVGFVGFNSGNNNTYGFLNDPALGSYVQVAAGVAGRTWAVKTFLEIQLDIVTAIQALRTQSQDLIDPESVDLTLAVATDSVDYLSKTSDFGISVRAWMTAAYPRIRVVSAPQLNDANAGDNVFYLYADRIQDQSTDGGATMIQVVPTKFMMLGVQQLAKSYEEDYSMATAGIMVKRPWAVVRYFNI